MLISVLDMTKAQTPVSRSRQLTVGQMEAWARIPQTRRSAVEEVHDINQLSGEESGHALNPTTLESWSNQEGG
jgi:hypothetical protein